MTLTLHRVRFGSGFDSLGDAGHLPFRVGFQQWQVEGRFSVFTGGPRQGRVWGASPKTEKMVAKEALEGEEKGGVVSYLILFLGARWGSKVKYQLVSPSLSLSLSPFCICVFVCFHIFNKVLNY